MPDFNVEFLDALANPLEKKAANAISDWTRSQIRGDYGNYPFTGGKIRGITRTLFDPVFYEILEERLTREDLLKRLGMRLVGRDEWYRYSGRQRYNRRSNISPEERERPWFETFGELAATILKVASKGTSI